MLILNGLLTFLRRCKLLIFEEFFCIRNKWEVVFRLILLVLFCLCLFVIVILIIFKIELFFLLINWIVVLKILLGEIIYFFLMNFMKIGLVVICFLVVLFKFWYWIILCYLRDLLFMRGRLFWRYFWRVEVKIEFFFLLVSIRLFLKISLVCYLVIFFRLKLLL